MSLSDEKVTIRLTPENLERVNTCQAEFAKCGMKISKNAIANSFIELGSENPMGWPNTNYITPKKQK